VVTSSTSEVKASARAANSTQDIRDPEGHNAQPFTGSIDETFPAHAQVTGASSDSSGDFSAGITGANDGQLVTVSSNGDATDADSASSNGATVANSDVISRLVVHFSTDTEEPVLLTGTLDATGTGQNQCGDDAEVDLVRKVPGPNNDIEIFHERVAATHQPELCGPIPNSGRQRSLHLIALLEPATDYEFEVFSGVTGCIPCAGLPPPASNSSHADASFDVLLSLGCPNTFTAQDDEITGTPGDDVLCGGDGNDTINGLGGDDILFGGAGEDTLSGRAGNDVLFGGDNADQIDGGADHDVIHAGAGDDAGSGGVAGGAGNDLIFGDAGDDFIVGGSLDTCTDPLPPGASDDDTIHGGAGSDTIGGCAGDDTILGEAGSDGSLTGNDGNDSIDGGPGDEVTPGNQSAIDGGAGQDSLHGGPGDDFIAGGDGHDEIFGEQGSDKLRGEGGPDILVGDDASGQPRQDVLTGGAGGDTLLARDGKRDLVHGGPGSDNARVDAVDVVDGVEHIQ
jgi:Ca2+-binding RTX toxin-like protein